MEEAWYYGFTGFPCHDDKILIGGNDIAICNFLLICTSHFTMTKTYSVQHPRWQLDHWQRIFDEFSSKPPMFYESSFEGTEKIPVLQSDRASYANSRYRKVDPIILDWQHSTRHGRIFSVYQTQALAKWPWDCKHERNPCLEVPWAKQFETISGEISMRKETGSLRPKNKLHTHDARHPSIVTWR